MDFTFFNWFLSLVFSVQFFLLIFVCIGVYALCLWLIDNLKSIVQIVGAILLPYFQPEENLTLAERYGNWAGKKRVKNKEYKIIKLCQ